MEEQENNVYLLDTIQRVFAFKCLVLGEIKVKINASRQIDPEDTYPNY